MAAKGTKKKTKATPGEKRRLRQLVVCLVLFGLVFLGRGMDVEPVERVTAAVSRLIRSDTDFQAVFAQMGQSFSNGEPAVETFHALWTGLLPKDETQAEEEQTEEVQAQETQAGETTETPQTETEVTQPAPQEEAAVD